uniref:Uncharacterized protein n=1 Tax=Solanum tuberosum TaxID=4113 RepID=M1CXS0_SOLTU
MDKHEFFLTHLFTIPLSYNCFYLLQTVNIMELNVSNQGYTKEKEPTITLHNSY